MNTWLQADARSLFLELVQGVLLPCARHVSAEAHRAAEPPEEEGSAREAVLDVLRSCVASGDVLMAEPRVSKNLSFFEWAHLLHVRPWSSCPDESV